MRIFSYITLALFLVSFVSAATVIPAKPKLVDGCYQIGTAQELYGFAAIVNGSNGMTQDPAACGKLTANIVVNKNVLKGGALSGDSNSFAVWTPIENFRGVFDGQYHTISGLYFNNPDYTEKDVGAALFASTKTAARDTIVIKNFGLEDSYFEGPNSAGFVAELDTGVLYMENVYNVSKSKSGFIGDLGSTGVRRLIITNAFDLEPNVHSKPIRKLYGYTGRYEIATNVYYIGSYRKSKGVYLTDVVYEDFENGLIASLLRSDAHGAAWGQVVGSDPYPLFKSEMSGYDGDLKFSKITWNAYTEHEPYPDRYLEERGMVLPEPTREGYVFIGWYEEEDLSKAPIKEIESKMTGDLNLYARWGKVPALVDGCYEIGTVEELFGFAKAVNRKSRDSRSFCGKLTANIDLNAAYGNDDKKWTYWIPIQNYSGIFDGNGFTIHGLEINRYAKHAVDTVNVGLFGSVFSASVTERSVIKNLGVTGVYLEARYCVGALVGGGYDLDIINSYAEGVSQGDLKTGGFVGCAKNVSVKESYFKGAVGYGCDCSLNSKGGLIGAGDGKIEIINSYFAGTSVYRPSGERNLGGLVGTSSDSLIIINSFAREMYETKALEGGLLGSHYSSSNRIVIENSFYQTKSTSDTIAYGATSAEFKNGTVATKLHNYNKDGVDGSVWGQLVGEDEYPKLIGKITVNKENSIVPKNPKLSDKGCYQIGTAEELYGFALLAEASRFDLFPICGELTADIVVNKNVVVQDSLLNGDGSNFITWLPIRNFNGTLDGKGHVISGLYYKDAMDTNAVAFIGNALSVDELYPSKIENLGIVDSYFRGSRTAAGLVGKVDEGSKKFFIRNSYNRATVHGYEVGGLIGRSRADLVEISQCYNGGALLGSASAGLLYYADGVASIDNSFNVGFVNGGFGLVRGVSDSLSVRNSYSVDLVNIDSPHGMAWIGASWISGKYSYDNVFGIELDPSNTTVLGSDSSTTWVTLEQFKNGSVATALHNYHGDGLDGSVWGQNVGVDSHPVFSGKIQNLSKDVIKSSVKFVTFDGDTREYYSEYVEGVAMALPFTARENHVFDGWYDNPTYAGYPVTEIPEDATGAKTYYAKWMHYPDIVENCYEIGDDGELFLFAETLNKIYDDSKNEGRALCAKLTADIVVNRNVLVDGTLNVADSSKFKRWIPITRFSGLFDGQGHSISGLFFSSSANYVGFIKEVFGRTVIRDLDIKDSYFNGYEGVSSLVSVMDGSSNLLLENVYSESYVYAQYRYGGGLVAYADDDDTLTVINCGKSDSTKMGNLGGGLLGVFHGTDVVIANSYNKGDVYGRSDVGGLLGKLSSGGSLSIYYSYNEGSVDGSAAIGGLFGETTRDLRLWNSYNVGTVTGLKVVGGLFGYFAGSDFSVVNTYSMATVVGDSAVGDLIGGTYKSMPVEFVNSYYAYNSLPDVGDTKATLAEFVDGTVAKKLHDYKDENLDGTAWVQLPNVDHPVLDGEVVESFVRKLPRLQLNKDDLGPESSSSTISSSSSSVQSSSSIDVYSSSENVSSSSVTSSSSVDTESSSSEAESSSSENPLVALGMTAAQFRVYGISRGIQVKNVRVGSAYAVFDMQGRTLQNGIAGTTDFVLKIQSPGRYLVKIADLTKSVIVK